MKLKIALGILIVCLSGLSYAATADEESSDQTWAVQAWDSLDRKSGRVKIKEAGATLDIPENFYFLDADDAKTLLVDIWKNPPGEPVLGILIPANMTPFDANPWAVTIEYYNGGYISDKGADEIDYTALLRQLQEKEQAANKTRIEKGFDPVEIVSWATEPHYESHTKKFYWAKTLKVGGHNPNFQLNYNIRMLGRKGVLVLNFIARINQKPIIDANIDAVLAMAEFDHGYRYSDFNPRVDKLSSLSISDWLLTM